MKKLLKIILKIPRDILKIPSLFMRNTSRAQLYREQVNRFCVSFYRAKSRYTEFKGYLDKNDATEKEKKKMFREYILLWHLISLKPGDYFKAGGKETTFKVKLKCITEWRRDIFHSSVNLGKYEEIVDDKKLFNEKFSDLLGREWILGDDPNLESFIDKYKTILVKPLGGVQGEGIHTISFDNMDNSEKQKHLKELNSKDILIEQVIKQKGILNQINPTSVNTVRINTLLDGENAVFLNAFFRTGILGQVTDNISKGGVLWQIDLTTGVVKFGVKVDGNIVYNHPDSNIKVAGMEIPRFFEAVEVCKRAQSKIPEVPQVGWDVVISDDGIWLIEGNSAPGFRNSEDNKDIWKMMKKYLYSNNIEIKKDGLSSQIASKK